MNSKETLMSNQQVRRSLTADEADAFGRELDSLRLEVQADLGERDVAHMRRVVRLAQRAEAGGRALLGFGLDPVTFVAGSLLLGTSKILENMEIGHNVMHGQYDWTRDPELGAHAYDWDNVCAASDWRHSHNVEHHTFTNIVGKDRDVGYGFLRITDAQPWNPTHLVQPLSASFLALFFQWGVALHDLRIDESLRGDQPLGVLLRRARPFARKATRQIAKDYLLFPMLTFWNAPRVFAGNLIANGIRNVWTFGIIFCGHFPDGVQMYSEEETHTESRGRWYLRQLNGSANLEGGRTFHILTGHLSHQIEHHLFPDLPAARYPEMAPRVREICRRYGQAYNTGSFRRQMGSVIARLVRHAVPGTVGVFAPAGRSRVSGPPMAESIRADPAPHQRTSAP